MGLKDGVGEEGRYLAEDDSRIRRWAINPAVANLAVCRCRCRSKTKR
jgi:hypothetical protein